MLLAISIVILLIFVGVGAVCFRYSNTVVVPEDQVAVTVDGNGFIKRILPSGRQGLSLFEKVDFYLETKPKLAGNQARAIVTGDGILMNVNWSGVYALRPDLITDNVSQRLRGLSSAEKAIARNVDIVLRGLMGDYPVQKMFKPALRERIERQLYRAVADRSKPLGINLLSLNLQAIDLPREVAGALNKARALEALDGAIRHLDPTTRQVVRRAYQLDGILHWDMYLPVPTRPAAKRLETVAD